MTGIKGQCPDDGTCHHDCPLVHGVGTPCFRVLAAAPLSGVFPGDKWPNYVSSAHEHAERIGIALAQDADEYPPVAFTKAQILEKIDEVEKVLLEKEVSLVGQPVYDVDDVEKMFHELRATFNEEPS